MKTSVAIYPGSFDPVTNGHLDLIERVEKMFDLLIVAVLRNTEKQPLFSVSERVEMLREVTKKWSDVEVDVFEGLLIDYARKRGAGVILRGISNELEPRSQKCNSPTASTVSKSRRPQQFLPRRKS